MPSITDVMDAGGMAAVLADPTSRAAHVAAIADLAAANRTPPPPARAPRRNAPEPNSERISSYSLRFLSSERTSYASDADLNFSSASEFPGL